MTGIDALRDERGGGAVAAPMAIAVLAMLAVIGLGIDGVRAAQGRANATEVAGEAARAAGQSLDTRQLRLGVATVDPARAVNAAQAYLADAGVTGTATVVDPQQIAVEVTVTRPTVLLGLIGIDSITSHGTAVARLVPVQPAPGG